HAPASDLDRRLLGHGPDPMRYSLALGGFSKASLDLKSALAYSSRHGRQGPGSVHRGYSRFPGGIYVPNQRRFPSKDPDVVLVARLGVLGTSIDCPAARGRKPPERYRSTAAHSGGGTEGRAARSRDADADRRGVPHGRRPWPASDALGGAPDSSVQRRAYAGDRTAAWIGRNLGRP